MSNFVEIPSKSNSDPENSKTETVSQESPLLETSQISADKYVMIEHEEDSDFLVIQKDKIIEDYDRSYMDFTVLGIGSLIKSANYIYENQWLDYLTKKTNQFSSSEFKAEFIGHVVKYGFPKKYRHAIWSFISGSLDFKQEMAKSNIYYEELSKKQCKDKDIKQIDLDIKRTFNNLGEEMYDSVKIELRAKLRRVLIAYCNINQDCEYIQGMNSIAGMVVALFNNLEKEQINFDKSPHANNEILKSRMELSESNAFWLFTTIMFKFGMIDMYSNNFDSLYKVINKLEYKLNEIFPAFLKKIKKLDLTCFSLFIVSYMTIFMHNLDMETSARVFDLFF